MQMEKIDLSVPIKNLIEESDLSPADLEKVEKYIAKTVPKILIQPKIKANWDERSASYFGGLPSLPSSEFWPVDKNGSAGLFLCQINCAEVHEAAPDLLPEQGMLFFFSWGGISEGESDLSGYPTVLYLDISPDTPPLEESPKGYKGGDILSYTFFYTAHTSLRLSESELMLTEPILPKFDMQFWYQDDFPNCGSFVDKYNCGDELSDLLYRLDEKIDSAALNQIRPRKNKNYRFLSPKAIRCHSYPPIEGKQYLWVDNEGYPWCRLNITLFMQSLLSDFHDDSRVAARKLEYLWEEFGLLEDYQVSYWPVAFLMKPTFKPILAKHPELKQIRSWLAANRPDDQEHFIKLEFYERTIDEVSQWISSFKERPYHEPDLVEKERFNMWIAERLNASVFNLLKTKGAASLKRTLAEGECLDGKPVKEFPDEEFKMIFRLRSSMIWHLEHTALDAATLLAAHSPEAASRLPESVYTWIDDECFNGRSHYLLGSPWALQNAAELNPDHLSLLTLEDDYRLMTACGAGTVLQFWIKPEDLRNKSFDKVIPSGECT